MAPRVFSGGGSQGGRGPQSEWQEETADQRALRFNYNAWKRIIKVEPVQNDFTTMRKLWVDALAILDGVDREYKQCLPRDLDADHEKTFGRGHIKALLGLKVRKDEVGKFLGFVRPFLLVGIPSHSFLGTMLIVKSSGHYA
jgi:hypothetical protein